MSKQAENTKSKDSATGFLAIIIVITVIAFILTGLIGAHRAYDANIFYAGALLLFVVGIPINLVLWKIFSKWSNS